MNKTKKLFILIAVVISLFLTGTVSPVLAATGYQGYAVYRTLTQYDEEIAEISWHAALMNKADNTYSTCVLHVDSDVSSSPCIQNWSAFLGNGVFKGVYIPKTSISSSQRDSVRSTASSLCNYNKAYVLTGQIDYSSSLYGNTKLYVSEITKLRCDGFVEYCYEANGIKIFGDTSNWNISVPSLANFNKHDSVFYINPERQAEDYMNPHSSQPDW